MKIPKTPVLAVDAIIHSNQKILLIKRNIEPFKDCWCLVGGKVEYGERVEAALKREVKEEVGLRVKIERFVGFFDNPKRDPRWHSISLAFEVKPLTKKIKTDKKEVLDARWFEVNKLPKKIGFDHRKIIERWLRLSK